MRKSKTIGIGTTKEGDRLVLRVKTLGEWISRCSYISPRIIYWSEVEASLLKRYPSTPWVKLVQAIINPQLQPVDKNNFDALV